MLIRFQVENFRSIRDAAELSLVAIDEDSPAARPVERLGVSLLTAAGIFGPNASGKSNVLEALAWLQHAVLDSLVRWEESIPVHPFRLGPTSSGETSFDLELAVDGLRFVYSLELDRERVSHESLLHYPLGRPRRIFERNGNSLELQRGLGVLAGTRSLLTRRTLALSIMRRFDEPLTSSFIRQIAELAVHNVPGRSVALGGFAGHGLRRSTEVFAGPPDGASTPAERSGRRTAVTRDRALALLRLADLGIRDVVVAKEVVDGPSGRTFEAAVPTFQHDSAPGTSPFELEDESSGTVLWFALVAPLLDVLDRGSVLLFDELDASLHPSLTAEVVRLFHDPTTNPHGAQLIFTTHDTNLLNSLGRDQVWLTEKDTSGATHLGPLSDFAGGRVRRSRDLESAYLSGRFGALPDLSRPDALRALGLTG